MSVKLRTKLKIGEIVKIIAIHKNDAYFSRNCKRFIGKIGIIKCYGEFTEKGCFSGGIEIINERLHNFYAVELRRIKLRKV